MLDRKLRMHFPRLWKSVSALILVNGLFMLGTVFVPRLSDGYGCIQLATGDYQRSPVYHLLDIHRGVYLPDPRAPTPTSYGGGSRDGRYYVYMQPDRSGSLSVVVSTGEGENETVVQEGVVLSDDDTNMDYFAAWSPDSRQFAYLWRASDGQVYLSVANPDGSNKRTAPFERPDGRGIRLVYNTRIASWSADSAYFLIGLRASSADRRYAFWSTSDLQQVTTPFDDAALRRGAWSPQGHRFAALLPEDEDTSRLVVFSPGGEVEPLSVSLPELDVRLISWSPQGEYLLIGSIVRVYRRRPYGDIWRFDIFDADNLRPLYSNLTSGPARITGEVASPYGSIPIPATWSLDGRSWIFARERTSEERTVADLVALDIATGRYEVLASSIVSPFVEELFYFPNDRLWQVNTTFEDLYILPESHRFMLPLWRDERMAVDFVDLEAETRVRLVEGADTILATSPTQVDQRLFWSSQGDWLIVPWVVSDGENPQVRFTIARPDGSQRYETEAAEAIRQPEWFWGDPDWFGYFAVRDGEYRLEIVNAQTGAQRSIPVLGDQSSWFAALAPQGEHAALLLQTYEDPPSSMLQNLLYVFSLTTLDLHQVTDDMMGTFSWSPDGSRLAILRADSMLNPVVEIVSADGSVLREWPLDSRAYLSGWFANWTNCD